MSVSPIRLSHSVALACCAAIATAALSAVAHAEKFTSDPQAAGRADAKAHALQTYGNLPLSFEANQGQTDASVQFLSHGAGYNLFLRANDAVLARKDATLRMALVGADGHAAVNPQNRLPGSVNYIHGQDAGRWTTDVQSFERVRYSGIYPGIDLIYYGNQSQLEYDFVVAPGADPKKIALNFDGAKAKIGRDGDLVLTTQGSETRFHKPVVYQMAGGSRVPVTGSYRQHGQQVSFTLGAYDHSRELIIDPVLSYMTYLGGSDGDYIGNDTDQATYGSAQGVGIAVDATGSVYVAGSTVSTNFPLKTPYQSTNKASSGQVTGFVTKLNPTGTAFVYSTYIGGSFRDYAVAIAVDSSGSAYITGTANSSDFPVTAGAFQTICGPNVNGSNVEVSTCGIASATSAFVAKLSPDGKSLVYSTFIGGNDQLGGTGGRAIVLDAKNEAYVVGTSGDDCGSSEPAFACFPTTPNAFVKGSENVFGGNTVTVENEAFLSVVSADGSSLLYSTLMSHPVVLGRYLYGTAVALDPAGNIYVAGETENGNLSTTPGAYQTTSGPATTFSGSTLVIPRRTWVAKFSPLSAAGGPVLTYLTYVGGTTTNGNNVATGITADAAGNAYVLGVSDNETDLPTTAGAYDTACNHSPAYLVKLNPTGSSLVWATCFGDAGNASVNATNAPLLDASGNVFFSLSALNGPPAPLVNPVLPNSMNEEAYVGELDPTGAHLLFLSPVGGPTGGTYSAGMAFGASGDLYVAGHTLSSDLPVTAGAAQASYGGGTFDSFIAKIVTTAPTATTTTVTLSAASVIAGQAVTLNATVTGTTGTATPTGTVTFKNGATVLGSQTLNGTATVTLTLPSLTVGTYNITAVYSGDNANLTSTSSAVSLTVTAPIIATTTSLAASPTTVVQGASVALTATVVPASGATATGTVTFLDGAATLGTGTLGGTGAATFSTTALTTGTHSLTASYAGSATDAASTSAAIIVTVTAPPPADFTLALAPTTGTISAGASASSVVSVTPVNGFSVATALTCSGLPAYATCSFSPATVTPNGTAAAPSTLTIATNVAAAMASNSHVTQPPLALAGLLGGLLFLPLLGRKSARARQVLSVGCMLFVATIVMGSIGGCSGGHSGGSNPVTPVTPSGTYAVTVTGTAGTTTHSATYTLIVQ